MTWDWTPRANGMDFTAEFHGYTVTIVVNRVDDRYRPFKALYRCDITNGQGQIPEHLTHWPDNSWPLHVVTIDEAKRAAERLVEQWFARQLAERMRTSAQ